MKPLSRRPAVWATVGTAGVLLLATACDKTTTGTAVGPVQTEFHHDNDDPYDGPPWFEDVTAASGVQFTYRNDEQAGHFAIIESLGGGVALLDYDKDGLLDIYIPGGGHYDGKKALGNPGRLYKNLGNFRFKDVTAEVGLDQPGQYSHGVAVADVNRDGYPDLLVTGYNRLVLYMNVPDGNGGRKFTDVTEQAKLTERLWSSGAAFADLDGDGFPDLYVCHYGDWGFDTNHPTDCTYDGKTRDVCAPKKFKALPHKVYRNNGDGTFTDVTATALARRENGKDLPPREDGKGLGVLIADLTGDGKPDLYVANDTDPNFLYVNRSKPGDIRFEEMGALAGVALDNRAQANGSMGIDCGDALRTGRPALFVTNYEGELHALYANHSTHDPKDPASDNTLFDFESHKNGLQSLGHLLVGWGTAFCDLDRDGWEDLVIVHGHAIRYPPGASGRAQYPKIVRNERGKFVLASNRGGSYFKARHDARGLALGDLNNDGKPHLVISHLNQPVAVLRNVLPTDNHWVGFELVGEKQRDVVGGKIVVKVGDQTYTRVVKSGGSYASANDPRYVVGIARGTKVDSVTVHWPNGKAQEWKDLAADRYWKLTEGEPAAN
ncbi:MAG TPA: CRTAC1 family protein [Gemmataceae bacterium]|nr:CRTAC1 family protein [Gemmataceae bacterium]